MVTPGYFGLQINAQSCCDSFRVCVTSNTGLLTEAMNTRIAELIEENIEKEKKKMVEKAGKTGEAPSEKQNAETKKDK